MVNRVAQRLDVCGRCEFLGMAAVCMKCGCVVALKARLPFAACPMGRWPHDTVAIEAALE